MDGSEIDESENVHSFFPSAELSNNDSRNNLHSEQLWRTFSSVEVNPLLLLSHNGALRRSHRILDCHRRQTAR